MTAQRTTSSPIPPNPKRVTKGRALAVAALALAAVAVVSAIGASDDGYRIEARFENAGQLVAGGQVQVAGRPVGSITGIDISDDGLASVELSIDDEDVIPLHRGTRASIRAVGQAGVTNRYVDLSPGPPDAPELEDDDVLSVEQTTGIVDLDALFNAFGPRQREDLSAVIENSAEIFAGSGANHFNSMLAKLDPALGEVQPMLRELAYDQQALAHLVSTGAEAARAVALRNTDLRGAVVNMSRTLTTIADEREALAGVLARAPAVFEKAGGTLARTSGAVDAIRPALRAADPASEPLSGLLDELEPTLRHARPVIADAAELEPRLGSTLTDLSTIQRPAVDGLRSLQSPLTDLQPILEGSRYYAPDFLLGVTNGLAGLLSSNYNSSGHYARLTFLQAPETTLSGLPALLLKDRPLVPGLLDVRTGLTAPCPGSSVPPAPDGSSPWIPDPDLCNPAHGVPESVLDFP